MAKDASLEDMANHLAAGLDILTFNDPWKALFRASSARSLTHRFLSTAQPIRATNSSEHISARPHVPFPAARHPSDLLSQHTNGGPALRAGLAFGEDRQTGNSITEDERSGNDFASVLQTSCTVFLDNSSSQATTHSLSTLSSEEAAWIVDTAKRRADGEPTVSPANPLNPALATMVSPELYSSRCSASRGQSVHELSRKSPRKSSPQWRAPQQPTDQGCRSNRASSTSQSPDAFTSPTFVPAQFRPCSSLSSAAHGNIYPQPAVSSLEPQALATLRSPVVDARALSIKTPAQPSCASVSMQPTPGSAMRMLEAAVSPDKCANPCSRSSKSAAAVSDSNHQKEHSLSAYPQSRQSAAPRAGGTGQHGLSRTPPGFCFDVAPSSGKTEAHHQRRATAFPEFGTSTSAALRQRHESSTLYSGSPQPLVGRSVPIDTRPILTPVNSSPRLGDVVRASPGVDVTPPETRDHGPSPLYPLHLSYPLDPLSPGVFQSSNPNLFPASPPPLDRPSPAEAVTRDAVVDSLMLSPHRVLHQTKALADDTILAVDPTAYHNKRAQLDVCAADCRTPTAAVVPPSSDSVSKSTLPRSALGKLDGNSLAARGTSSAAKNAGKTRCAGPQRKPTPLQQQAALPSPNEPAAGALLEREKKRHAPQQRSEGKADQTQCQQQRQRTACGKTGTPSTTRSVSPLHRTPSLPRSLSKSGGRSQTPTPHSNPASLSSKLSGLRKRTARATPPQKPVSCSPRLATRRETRRTLSPTQTQPVSQAEAERTVRKLNPARARGSMPEPARNLNTSNLRGARDSDDGFCSFDEVECRRAAKPEAVVESTVPRGHLFPRSPLRLPDSPGPEILDEGHLLDGVAVSAPNDMPAYPPAAVPTEELSVAMQSPLVIFESSTTSPNERTDIDRMERFGCQRFLDLSESWGVAQHSALEVVPSRETAKSEGGNEVVHDKMCDSPLLSLSPSQPGAREQSTPSKLHKKAALPLTTAVRKAEECVMRAGGLPIVSPPSSFEIEDVFFSPVAAGHLAPARHTRQRPKRNNSNFSATGVRDCSEPDGEGIRVLFRDASLPPTGRGRKRLAAGHREVPERSQKRAPMPAGIERGRASMTTQHANRPSQRRASAAVKPSPVVVSVVLPDRHPTRHPSLSRCPFK
ncbi:hypothetical protein DIPPA_51660 [Diplonema papillatum]|nr:hypothetical protein DIPPA_51660 [Diplonema papillatum]